MKEIVTPEMRRQRQAHYCNHPGGTRHGGIDALWRVDLSAQRVRINDKLLPSVFFRIISRWPSSTPTWPAAIPANQWMLQYEWFATHALFTAETLLVLVGDDPRWKSSIAFIVRQHRGYLEHGHFICGNFSSGFVTYVKSQIKDLKCAR